MRLFLLYAIFLLMPAVAQEELPTILATPAQRAAVLIEEERWDELDALGDSLTNSEPHNWRGWYFRGVAKAAFTDMEPAVVFLERAVRLLPDKSVEPTRYLELTFRLANAKAQLGNWVEAEAGYREALRELSDAPALWDKLRLALVAQEGEEKRREEVEVLTKMFTFDVYLNHYDLWRRYAELLDSFSRTEEARVAYGNALRLRPKDLKVAEWIFLHDIAGGDKDAADAAEKILLKLDAKHPMVNVYLGDLARAAGDRRRALKYYRIATENPYYRREQARAHTGIGNLLGGKNNNGALDNYLQAINSDPSYLPGWEGAAIVLRFLNQHNKSSRYLARKQQVQRRLENGEPITQELLEGL